MGDHSMTEFGANFAFGIYGVATSHRIAWSAYLVLSVAGLVMMSAATPISALWLTLKLLQNQANCHLGLSQRLLF
jgi:hypothetical protein